MCAMSMFGLISKKYQFLAKLIFYKTKAVVGGTAGPAMAGPLFWPKMVLAVPFLGVIMINFCRVIFSADLDFLIR